MKAGRLNIKKIAYLILVLFVMLLFSGCLPPRYTSEHKKEIFEQNYPKVVQWFEDNYPEAKPIKKRSKAYADATDLYAIIEGAYGVKGKAYYYYYDYYNNQMYLNEAWSETEDMVASEICSKVEVDALETDLSFKGIALTTHLENDNFERYPDLDINEIGTTKFFETIPFGMDASTAAKGVLDGSIKSQISGRFTVSELPDCDTEIFEEFPNLWSLSFERSVDIPYNGYYYKMYMDDSVTGSYCHIEKLDDDFYVGYVYMNNMDYVDELMYERNGNEIVMKIPKKADPILISKKRHEIVHHFTNSREEQKEVKLSDDEKVRINDSSYRFFYTRSSFLTGDGTYYFRILK